MANNFESSLDWTQAAALSKTAKFMSRVYGWMMLGVALSGFVAYGISQNTQLAITIAQTPGAIWGIFILQLALVIGIPKIMNRISSTLTGLLYFLYAGVTGITLSFIFLMYAQSSIFMMFFLTAFAFAGLSATGYLTKKDLGPIGSFCMMAVWGMIGYAIIAFIFPSFGGAQGSFIFSAIGLVVFSGLTAFHTQKIKALYQRGAASEEADRKLAIFGALILYIDFINLFLSMLRIFGRRR